MFLLPWVLMVFAGGLGLFVGFVLGYSTGRGRRKIQRVPLLVFPSVKTGPVVFEAEGLRAAAAAESVGET